MSEKYILIGAVVLIIIVVFIVLLVIVKNGTKTVVVTKKSRQQPVAKKRFTIKEMTEIAARTSSTTAELKKAIDIVKNDLKFPPKKNSKLPKDIKIYLNFVLLISSHKNADAKLIAYMDRELKKANPGYLTEIDIYENEGFKERANRL